MADEPRVANRLWLAAVALAGAAAIGYMSWVAFLDSYSRTDETRSAGAIVVLGAGVEVNGEPSDAMQARMEHGLWLYENGYAPLIVLTGGERVRPPGEALVMAAWFEAQGVPPEALVLETESLYTDQNAAFSGPLLRERGIGEIVLVTSPFHQWRAERAFEKEGFEVYLSPAPNDAIERRPFNRPYFFAREGLVSLVTVALSW